MSVVGFDIGYQSCHVAIARHGGVEIVNNEYSDRKNPTMVAITQKQRLMGTSARNQAVTNYKNTIWGFTPFLGRKYSDPVVQEEIKRVPYQVVERPGNEIGIKVTGGEGEQVYSPQQITAMMLTYLKKVAEKSLGKPVADCVISVPSFFLDSQRRAMLDASAIAGLNCLRLINDTTAAALAYGIYKQDLPEEKEKPRNVVFVDLGHSSLQVIIVAFQKGKLKVLSKDFDPFIGGRLFDERLMRHFSAEFKKRYNIDSLTRPRQTMRLTTECERLKKSMGTITQSVSISLDCFADDRDLTGKIKREEHMELCKDILERVRIPMENALAKSGLSLADIYAVELIGGATRIPAIKEIIGNMFKRELSTTLNLDEAVSRGCALQCAMLSPTFKVRDFSVTDIQPYPIQLKWQTAMDGEVGEMVVFNQGDPIYRSKVLSFFRKESFDLEAVYANPVPFMHVPQIGTFKISNVTPNAEGDASKVKVKVRMNIHGIFMIKNATLVEKQTEEPEPMETEAPPTKSAPSTEAAATATTTTTNGQQEATPAESQEPQSGTTPPGEGEAEQMQSEDQSQQQQQQQEQQSQEQQQQQGGGGGSGAAAGGEEGTDAAPPPEKQTSNDEMTTGGGGDDSPPAEKKGDGTPKPPEAKKAKKPAWKYVDLPITSVTSSATKKEIVDLREIEVNLNYRDQLEREKADARNSVEEYVYSMRDKLDYDLNDYIIEADKETFKGVLNSMEDWLYEEGEDQPKKVYVDKLAELKKLGDPVVTREQEWRERPPAFEELVKRIVHYERILQKYAEGDEAYNHLEQTEMDKVKEQVTAKRTWHDSQSQACHALAKTADPPVTVAQIKAESKNLETACHPIVTKPKPKVEPPKDENKEEAKKEEGEATTTKETPAAPETPADSSSSSSGPTAAGEGGEGEKMEEDPKPAATEGGEQATSSKDEDMDLD